MDELTTASGRVFSCDYFNVFAPAKQVNLRVLNTSLVTAAAVFSDPKETVQLWCGDQYLSQHTKLVALVPESGAIRVILERE